MVVMVVMVVMVIRVVMVVMVFMVVVGTMPIVYSCGGGESGEHSHW